MAILTIDWLASADHLAVFSEIFFKIMLFIESMGYYHNAIEGITYPGSYAPHLAFDVFYEGDYRRWFRGLEV